MKKALVVPFHPGQFEQNDLYRVYSDAWLSCWEKMRSHFDKAYIIDHLWDFKTHHQDIEVIKVNRNHWDNLSEVLPNLKEDIIGIADCDTLFYAPRVIEFIFNRMEKGAEVVSVMDGSGGVSLTDKYPELGPNHKRAERRRFAPYLCFVKNKILKKTSYDFKPYNPGQKDWRDSFGRWSEQVFQLGVPYTELPDDRTTLRLFPDGKITKDTWLDGAGYLWSMPLDKTNNFGYYHIRNFSLGTKILHGAVDDSVVPYDEAMRTLGWLYQLTERFAPLELDSVMKAVKKYKVADDNWYKYMAEWRNYHNWITLL